MASEFGLGQHTSTKIRDSEKTIYHKSQPACRVLKVDGPKEVVIGESAKYRVVSYSLPPAESDKQRVKWKIEVQLRKGGFLESLECEKNTKLFQVGKGEMTIQKMPTKWSRATIKVFAYLKESDDQVTAKTLIKFKPFVIAETKKHKPGVGPDWGSGDYTVSKYESISSACKDDELLKKSDKELLAYVQKLLGHFAPEDHEGITNKMFLKFSAKAGGEFTDPSLTQKVQAHATTKAFLDQVQRSFGQTITTNHGQLVIDQELSRNNWNRIYFNTDSDLTNGLMILIDEVWAYVITIKDYELTSPNQCQASLQITIYDHFGLDEEDILTYGGGAPWNNNATVLKKLYLATHTDIPKGFRSWFILQHLRNYKPVLTKVEFYATIQASW